MSSAEKRDTGLFQPALPDVDPVHVTGKQGDYLFRVLIEKRADHFTTWRSSRCRMEANTEMGRSPEKISVQ